MKTLPILTLAGLLTAAVLAEPVTPASIELASIELAPAWRSYLDRSAAIAAADQEALRAELAAQGMEQAIPAPTGGDFKLSEKPGSPWYSGNEAGSLADIVISYQAPSGGWSKKSGYSKGPRRPGMLWSSQYKPGKSPHYLCTYDNRSTTEQLQFLAGVWLATGREDCREAFEKGLDYVLVSQFPNGGWPQVYPLEGDYHDCITLNDDAMTHILELLSGIAREDPQFAFLDDGRRGRAADALARGIDCVIRMQVVQDGRRTAWSAQHDAVTMLPTGARKMEPAALSGIESANLLKFLMSLPDPEPRLVECIEGGLAWLESVKITGIRKTKEDGRTTYVSDPSADEAYWARFYDLADSRPIFPGRDGKVYGSFAEMAAGNELGYDFYSTRPGSVLTNSRKKWLKALEKRKSP